MTSTTHDLSHLLALVEAARQEADRVGAAAASVSERLGAASTELRAMLARDGKVDEGIRPADLTTDNDR